MSNPVAKRVVAYILLFLIYPILVLELAMIVTEAISCGRAPALQSNLALNKVMLSLQMVREEPERYSWEQVLDDFSRPRWEIAGNDSSTENRWFRTGWMPIWRSTHYRIYLLLSPENVVPLRYGVLMVDDSTRTLNIALPDDRGSSGDGSAPSRKTVRQIRSLLSILLRESPAVGAEAWQEIPKP